MYTKGNVPEDIVVGFYFKEKPYYTFGCDEWAVQEITPNGILTFLEEIPKEDLCKYYINHWKKVNDFQMKRDWSCDGEYFMAQYQLKQLDK